MEKFSSSLPSDQRRNEQFVSLFVRNQWNLFSYIFSLLSSWSDAEDVFQQTSIVLWRKFEQFDQQEDPQGDFIRWACQIARYESFNYMRKHRRDRHVFSDKLHAILAEEGMADMEQLEKERRALAGCLDQLQSRHQHLIKQCYAGTNTITHIAQVMGCTPNSLYKRLKRIRVMLLSCVERSLAVEGKS